MAAPGAGREALQVKADQYIISELKQLLTYYTPAEYHRDMSVDLAFIEARAKNMTLSPNSGDQLLLPW